MSEASDLKMVDRGSEWAEEHKDYLIENYSGEFVAVQKDEVIAHDASINVLKEKIQNKKDIDGNELTVRFISPNSRTSLVA